MVRTLRDLIRRSLCLLIVKSKWRMAVFTRLSSLGYSWIIHEEILRIVWQKVFATIYENSNTFAEGYAGTSHRRKFSRILDYYLNEPRINCQHFPTLRRARSLVALQICKYFAVLHINYHTLVLPSVHFQLSSRHVLAENYITHKYTLVHLSIFRTFERFNREWNAASCRRKKEQFDSSFSYAFQVLRQAVSYLCKYVIMYSVCNLEHV